MTAPKADLLVVDDTVGNLQLLIKLLSGADYAVRPAPNGTRALAAVAERLPDLILLDVMMPQMNGYEVCQRLKANPQSAGIPVIFISALDEVFDKVTAFSVGGVDYITKPFQAEEIFARIKTHLTIRQLQQELKEKNASLQNANQSLEKKVNARTAQLEQSNQSLSAEIERRTQYQTEKEHLYEIVSQQSEQVRNMTNLLIESQQTERRGLVNNLNHEVEENLNLLRSELQLALNLFPAQTDSAILNHLGNALTLSEKVSGYLQQLTANLQESTQKEETLSHNPLLKLTARESEALQLIAQGKTNAEIANLLGVSLSTVHTYTRRIKQKLDIDNLPSLIKFAIEHKLLD